MVGRIAASIGLVCLTLTFGVNAAGTDDDIMAGRARMFEGTVAGFAQACQIFDAAAQNADGSDDTDGRELAFLHAVTRAVVLFHNHGDMVSADRFFALAEEFGINLAQSTLADVKAVLSLGRCRGPVSLDPGGNGPGSRDFVLAEWSDIIAELDSISDAPAPFTVCSTPQETGLTGPVEVDYGEVLVLKGLLLAYQAELEAQTARILDTDPETTGLGGCVVESVLRVETTGAATKIDLSRVVDDCVHDALYRESPRPVAQMAGPGAGDDGAAMSAQAAERLGDAIACYLNALDYMLSENLPPAADPQEDELLYLGPDASTQMKPVQARLRAWRRSLQSRTSEAAVETLWTYDLRDAGGDFLGELILTQDSLGPNGCGGWLTMRDGTVLSIEWMDIGPDNAVVMDLRGRDAWRQAWLEGTFSAGRDSISNGTMDYWGQSARTVASVTGQRTQDSGWPVGLEADQVRGGTVSETSGRRDAGVAMCDSPGGDPYHAHWPGLLEAPLSLNGPPPCMTLSGRAVPSQSRRFADSRAALPIDERASFSVGFERIK